MYTLDTISEAIGLFVELMKEGVYIDDMTSDLSGKEIKRTKMFSLVKAKEIREWLAQSHFSGAWVVIDDKDLHDSMIKSHQIMCDPAKGISWDDVYAAISILETQ